MAWTSPDDLRAQVQKRWDKGELLAALVVAQQAPQAQALAFPWRLRLVTPGSSELAQRFTEARAWAGNLRAGAVHYRLEERALRHREVGHHSLPEAAWVDSLDAALALIGKTADARRFAALVAATAGHQPVLLPWLARRPLQALALAAAWPRLLAVVAWLQAHPRPGIYLRQMDLPGVDTKFTEAHRGVLTELLDLALAPVAVDATASGVGQFARRYGFADKPLRIRLRWLDAAAGGPWGSDITITQAAFEALEPPVRRVFITENEVNFLALPAVAGSLVVFGAGYGFEALAGARWLHLCAVHYWGDIDTHGFAILDQLRATVPHAQSLLMDRATLLAHADHWGHEPQPLSRDLPRLRLDEAAIYDDLRFGRVRAEPLRLEQERIGFGWVQKALAALPPPGSVA
jgi:hypothetical protein